jgi:nucleotide-binding universal stress UspA family protein
MRVLLGLAGSEESMRALEQTVERAVEAGDDLTVAVIEKDDMSRSRDVIADDARSVAQEHGLDVDVRFLEGDPGAALVDVAEREGFDELAIGGGTESPMGKIRLGPVTEFVLLNATMSVRLVR